MFERFTDRARRVVVVAQEESRLLGHDYIGTEHLLLALVADGDGVASKTLERLGVSLELVRRQVEDIIGRGSGAPGGHIPFTPRAKKVLELSLREALDLKHDYIGTEHILLGLVREGNGVAAQTLVKLGVGLERVRAEVLQMVSKGAAGAEHERVEGGEADEGLAVEGLGKGRRVEDRPPVATVTVVRSPQDEPVEDMPGCPTCGSALATSAAWASLDVAGPDGTTRPVLVVYCARCGRAVGTVPR